MKQKLFTLTLLLLTFFILSTKSFAQSDSGGLETGGGGTPDLSIALGGTAGVFAIPATSPYYSFIVSALRNLKATISPTGVVTFPTSTTYYNCLQGFYYTGCINSKTYYTCKSQPPPRSCGGN